MDWKRIEGNWKRFRSKVKDKWGKLSDDDLDVINGRRDRLEGKIQQRYGFATDHVSKEVDDWFRWQDLNGLGPRTKRSAQDAWSPRRARGTQAEAFRAGLGR